MSDTALMPTGLNGFNESVISVASFSPWRDFFADAIGWQCSPERPVDPALLKLWRAPDGCAASEVLVSIPDYPGKYLRLYCIDIPNSTLLRPDDANSWDTGGIFDINFRVGEIDDVERRLSKCGWEQITDIIRWHFSGMHVAEWLRRGPDAAVFVFISRLAPPLQGWKLNPISYPFNSSQTVADINRAEAFYNALGFTAFISQDGILPDGGAQVLGLSAEEADQCEISIRVLAPDGRGMDGSVELIQIPKPGRQFCQQATPAQRGLSTLRFAVKDISQYVTTLEARGIAVQPPGIVQTNLPPYGECLLAAVVSPDNAWLEFYQPL